MNYSYQSAADMLDAVIAAARQDLSDMEHSGYMEPCELEALSSRIAQLEDERSKSLVF